MTVTENQFSDAFSTAFDPHPLTDPTVESCWPVDASCCGDWASYPPEVQSRASLMAEQTLRILTGYRVGGCPIVLRPCADSCMHVRTWAVYPVTAGVNWAGAWNGFVPTVIDGAWYNVGCGCGISGCSCSTVCEITLPGEPGSILDIVQDGMMLDPSTYRLDNGNRLVRTDGQCWPLCQNMAADLDQPGTLGVHYMPGIPVDSLGALAAGELACEYAKACQGKPCRLPANATNIARQGVTIDLTPGLFPNGRTGIQQVDLYVQRWNPHHLTSAPGVWSPDVRRGRVTTWSPT